VSSTSGVEGQSFVLRNTKQNKPTTQKTDMPPVAAATPRTTTRTRMRKSVLDRVKLLQAVERGIKLEYDRKMQLVRDDPSATVCLSDDEADDEDRINGCATALMMLGKWAETKDRSICECAHKV